MGVKGGAPASLVCIILKFIMIVILNKSIQGRNGKLVFDYLSVKN